MLCETQIAAERHTGVRLAGCGHATHYECFLSANLVRRVMSCPVCVPNQVVAEDYGDCINMAELQLEDFMRRNMEVAAGKRDAEYVMADAIAHAAELAAVDGATDADRVVATVAAVAGAPMAGLQTWMPDATRAQIDMVRDLVRVHTSPRQLRTLGVNRLSILNARLTLDDLLRANYTLKEIHDLGFDRNGLVTLGFRAAHLDNAAAVSVHDMRNIYTCTFEDVIQIESKYFLPYGALLSYLTVKLDLAGHRMLGLPGLHALRAHGLDRLALLVFSKTLPFLDLCALGLDTQMLREFDMLNVADLQELGAVDAVASEGSIESAASLIRAPAADIRRPVVPGAAQPPPVLHHRREPRNPPPSPQPQPPVARGPVPSNNPLSGVMSRVLGER